ncbi:hypothetical protein G6F38_010376 [Rhizopus arrhizus]|nr:hypothetical protein G6F38_010376 [Rhizopus arrhizus]
MLNPTGNYFYQLIDPDVCFDWDTIEKVLVSSSEVEACSICLYPPVAGRVTRCGHVFCLPCILHYLESSEKSWQKCPVCCDPICEKDIKPIKITAGYSIKEGDLINLVLVQRAHQSALAFPISETWPLPENVVSNYIKPDISFIPWSSTPFAQSFARFMLASPDYLLSEYDRDCKELEEALLNATDRESAEEIRFIKKSKDRVDEERKRTECQKTEEIMLALSTLDIMFEAIVKYNKKHKNKQHPPKQGSNNCLQKLGEKENNKKHQQHDSLNDFYFYQKEDGQHVYLDPLDVRILKHEFGRYDQFPHCLQAQVIGVQESTLDECLRRKNKYLNHVPLNCDVTFVEINLKNIVSSKTLQAFSSELNARFKRREDKENQIESMRKQQPTCIEGGVTPDINHQLNNREEQLTQNKLS